MEIVIFKKTLIKFLKKERLFTKFTNNLDKPINNLLKEVLPQFCKSTVLKQAFIWSDTPEGYDYWKKKSGIWATYLFSNKDIYNDLNNENRIKMPL